jgi:serine/threonine protein kinase
MDATQITAEGRVIGTVPYMAPERMRAAGAGGPASDVYALATVAYELLSGSPLEAQGTGDEPSSLHRRLAAGWPDAPSAVFAVVSRALSEDPARRQLSAGQFVDELESALRRREETRPFTPPPPEVQTRPLLSRSPDLSRSSRSRVGAMIALALVLVAGVAVAGIALSGGGSGDGSGTKQAKKKVKADKGSGGSDAADTSPTTPSEEVAAAPAEPATPSSTDAATLNAQGFELINEGRPAEAVPILRRAVAAFPEDSTDLDYAYALYNLGNALRLSGHPEQAIPVLERRLQIPNQTSTVAAELARARAEAATG